jgi:hypothetical protein
MHYGQGEGNGKTGTPSSSEVFQCGTCRKAVKAGSEKSVVCRECLKSSDGFCLVINIVQQNQPLREIGFCPCVLMLLLGMTGF